MDTSTGAPPVIAPRRSITYELTRGDVFANVMTICLRNRILQIFIPIALVLNMLIVLTRQPAERSLPGTMMTVIFFLFEFLLVVLFTQVLIGVVSAFMQRQKGVVGRHTMEISDQGLIERTDVNETLHKWPGVTRVLTLFGYLYIYVGDNNSFAIPRRGFAPGELENFETELRQHMEQSRG